ncbi:MAG: hypothetical protein FGF48_01715 [Candidatus Brockarchaeota archaeon]|nr:hypothetical protein [Candidatus Brockarchaeota archaeon]
MRLWSGLTFSFRSGEGSKSYIKKKDREYYSNANSVSELGEGLKIAFDKD